MVTLERFNEMYIKFQFWGSGALYLRFETCKEDKVLHFCSYLRHKQKLLILSRLNDFMACSAHFNSLEKWPVSLGFASGDRPFFQTPLNPSSQIVSPVTLLISHYLYNMPLVILKFVNTNFPKCAILASVYYMTSRTQFIMICSNKNNYRIYL